MLLVAVSAMSLSSCSEDKLGDTIFPDVDESLDPTSYTYKLDKFLKENYLEKYNLTFLYKMPDVSTNMNYNLVPATYENSIDLAVLCKHLWFDVYDKVAGPDFLKTYGPRIILLIGSPAYNPTSGTEIVGLAEGGIKISLFKVNAMSLPTSCTRPRPIPMSSTPFRLVTTTATTGRIAARVRWLR